MAEQASGPPQSSQHDGKRLLLLGFSLRVLSYVNTEASGLFTALAVSIFKATCHWLSAAQVRRSHRASSCTLAAYVVKYECVTAFEVK